MSALAPDIGRRIDLRPLLIAQEAVELIERRLHRLHRDDHRFDALKLGLTSFKSFLSEKALTQNEGNQRLRHSKCLSLWLTGITMAAAPSRPEEVRTAVAENVAAENSSASPT
jgi:hypothetical protein